MTQASDESASLLEQLGALFANERDALANAANMSAVLYQSLSDVNWAGFYFLRQRELVLGPFQGKVACDSESRSEIVVPLRYRQRVVGVLDIDSPRLSRFDQRDAAALEAAVHLFIQSSDLHNLVD